jgi:hypothetical protein
MKTEILSGVRRMARKGPTTRRSIVIETFDGHYAATGRYIVSEAFHCFLLKTDTAGNPVFMKAYGDTLQNVTVMELQIP